MAARRKPGWASFTELEPPNPEQVELQGLSVIVAVLERMDDAERARALRWLVDRYGPKVSLGGEP